MIYLSLHIPNKSQLSYQYISLYLNISLFFYTWIIILDIFETGWEYNCTVLNLDHIKNYIVFCTWIF